MKQESHSVKSAITTLLECMLKSSSRNAVNYAITHTESVTNTPPLAIGVSGLWYSETIKKGKTNEQ